MTTLRETYIQALIAALTAAPGLGATVERSIVKARAIADGAAVVVVHRGGELEPDQSKTGVVDRVCEILVSVLARDDAPDQVADTVLAVAHPLVMAYRAAQIMDIWEGQTDTPKFSDTGGTTGLTTVHYFIRYRTSPNSLTA